MGINYLKSGIIKVFDGFYISIFSVFTLFFLSLYDRPLYIFLLLSSAVIHELGHIIPLFMLGAKIKSVTIFPFGIDIFADTKKLSYKKEFVCTIGGAAANFLAALISFAIMQKSPSPELLFFAVTNISLGIFNLIPLPFLDGGRALRLAVYDVFEITLADDIIRAVDVISIFLFSALSFLLVARADFNLSIVFIVIYGIVSVIGKRKRELA